MGWLWFPMLRGFAERLVHRECHQEGSPQLAPNTSRGDSLRNLDINKTLGDTL